MGKEPLKGVNLCVFGGNSLWDVNCFRMVLRRDMDSLFGLDVFVF